MREFLKIKEVISGNADSALVSSLLSHTGFPLRNITHVLLDVLLNMSVYIWVLIEIIIIKSLVLGCFHFSKPSIHRWKPDYANLSLSFWETSKYI